MRNRKAVPLYIRLGGQHTSGNSDSFYSRFLYLGRHVTHWGERICPKKEIEIDSADRYVITFRKTQSYILFSC